MNKAWFKTPPQSGTKAFGVVWGLHLPGAHPIWNDYVILLYDLTTPLTETPIIYLDGATHEILLYAVNPDRQLLPETPIADYYPALLHPANHGYQFKAASNDAATARIQLLVDEMLNNTLSPDTDWRSAWDAKFADGTSLLNRT